MPKEEIALYYKGELIQTRVINSVFTTEYWGDQWVKTYGKKMMASEFVEIRVSSDKIKTIERPEGDYSNRGYLSLNAEI